VLELFWRCKSIGPLVGFKHRAIATFGVVSACLLRASVGTTDAAASLPARFGVVGPTRAATNWPEPSVEPHPGPPLGRHGQRVKRSGTWITKDAPCRLPRGSRGATVVREPGPGRRGGRCRSASAGCPQGPAIRRDGRRDEIDGLFHGIPPRMTRVRRP